MYSSSRRCKRGLGGEPVVDDPAANFVGEGGVAQDRFMDGKDGRFVVPTWLATLCCRARSSAAALSRAVS